MTSSSEDYLIKRGKQIERKKRIITIVSVVSFVGSTVFAVVPAIQQAIYHPQSATPQSATPPSATPPSATASAETALQQEVRSYELVLKREPDNQVALEKLSVLRLQLKDTKGSVEILQKLVRLHPDRQDYKALLEQMKKPQGKEN
ncbi:hypothetical protein NIES4074_53700 [Cylindrospermum sp. NIES-4074]|nr:hypothetical protein NIES4074_53700 [Cylindrospermum sp. NIES-4074]